MICPECEKEIDEVYVISRCWQKGSLTENRIYEYGSIEEILGTITIECPKCSKNIKSHIKEV